jgi:hypothetical protein
MNFIDRGVYQDENMPEIDQFRSTVMGIAISPLIDLSEGLEILGTIRSGQISWYSRPIEGTSIEVLSSIDDGTTWNRLNNNQNIENVEQLNYDPTIKLKYIVKSYISQLVKDKSPKLFSVTITLSNVNENVWSETVSPDLNWN